MKKPSCCDTTAKILLVIFNCIFWAFGVAILGVGIWIKTDPELSNLGQAVKVGDSEPVVEIITWLFIGAGIFVFAVGVVGMIGIIRESKIMMGFYILCVFVVFAAEASAGVYAGVRKDYIIEQIEKKGMEFINSSYGNTDADKSGFITRGFNYVQVKHKCCGVKNFMDYSGSMYLKNLGNKVKASATLSWACCNTETTLDDAFKGDGRLKVNATTRDLCMDDSIQATLTYEDGMKQNKETALEKTKKLCSTFKEFHCQKGCLEALQDWTDENLIIMVGIAIAIGGSQLILLFLALWFCQSLGRDVN